MQNNKFITLFGGRLRGAKSAPPSPSFPHRQRQHSRRLKNKNIVFYSLRNNVCCIGSSIPSERGKTTCVLVREVVYRRVVRAEQTVYESRSLKHSAGFLGCCHFFLTYRFYTSSSMDLCVRFSGENATNVYPPTFFSFFFLPSTSAMLQ